MSTALTRIAGIGLALVLLGGSACQEDAGTAHASNLPANLSQRQAHFGGDQRAWPTTHGDWGDSAYCAAQLQLPLSREPAWIADYTAAEFSTHPASPLLHYDGTLVLAARSPQLIGLDVDTGARVFNAPYYQAVDSLAMEELRWMFISPQGLIMVRDDQGRYYLLDELTRPPRRLWISAPTNDIESGYVVTPEYLYTAWGSQLRCLALADGEEQWRYPTLTPAGGVVLAHDVVVWWSRQSKLVAVDASTGWLRWSVQVPEPIWRAICTDRNHDVYLIYSERVECRDLFSGDLRWEYDWSKLMSDTERTQRFAESGMGRKGFEEEDVTVLLARSPMLTPEGLILTLVCGEVLAFDHQGQVRWRYSEPGHLLLGQVAFANGILLWEAYVGPEYFGGLQRYRLFSLQPPAWAAYQAASSGEQQRGVFLRQLVLDPASGTGLDGFDFSTVAAAGPVPAYGKIVYSEEPVQGVYQRRVLAYDWLVWEDSE